MALTAVDAIAVDATPRLRRVALLAQGKVVEVAHERSGDAPRVGDVWLGRLARAAPEFGGAFIDLGPGGEGFLKVPRATVPEGALLALEVVTEAARGKLARVRRARRQDAAEGPPRRIAPAPAAAAVWLGAEPGIRRVILEGRALAAEASAWLAASGREDVAVEVRGPALFEELGIEAALDEAVAPRLPLPGGGALGVEEGRALTAIDVDSAGRTGRGARATALATNLAAAAAIGPLLRLRDIAGLIVADFIGMTETDDRRAVMASLREGLAPDRRVRACHGLSPLGLAEMARARRGPSLGELRDSATGVADRIARGLRAEIAGPPGPLSVTCAPDVAAALGDVARLESWLGRHVTVERRGDWPRDRFEVRVVR